MERRGVSLSRSRVSFSDRLVSLCEYYMLLGVPYDEFWHGDYCKLKFYEKRYYDQLKMQDATLWRQGLYFYRGLEAVFGQLMGNSKAQYPKEPLLMQTPEEEKTPEQLQAEITAQLKATIRETR